MFVRSGSAIVFSAEPEGLVTLTAINVDTDFALDQFFWQHSTVLHDRLDAQGFAERVYSEPAQVLRLGRDRAGMVTPWLDHPNQRLDPRVSAWTPEKIVEQPGLTYQTDLCGCHEGELGSTRTLRRRGEPLQRCKALCLRLRPGGVRGAG